MTILDEVNGTVETVAIEGIEQGVARETVEAVGGFDGTRFFEMLKKKTGEGSIEEYTNHPLNYEGTKEMGQVIRGCTGLLGALDFAVLDIGLGLMKIMTKRKAAAAIENS